MKPKSAVERNDEGYSKHSDAIGVVFSHSPLPTNPLKETPDELPVDGGVFYILRGDKVVETNSRARTSPLDATTLRAD